MIMKMSNENDNDISDFVVIMMLMIMMFIWLAFDSRGRRCCLNEGMKTEKEGGGRDRQDLL